MADRETLEVPDSSLVLKITYFAYLVEIEFRFPLAPGLCPCILGIYYTKVNFVLACRG